GFAIPTALVKAVLSGITQTGKVVRPYLGASGQPVTSDIAHALKLARRVGVLINTVAKDGPAAEGGLRIGDVVVAVQGREVDDPDGMRFRLATLPVGEDARLTVLRDGVERQVTVRLIAPPELPPRDASDIAGANPCSGATLANLNPALAEELGMETNSTGVVLLRIQRGSIAHRLRLQPGDIILKINERPVGSVAEVKRVLAADPPGWRAVINRDGQVLELAIGR
ncbi:MAG: PDZ domain-containing protein, partial [Magnetospirillum sp.]|nr:PDZ domain-containing protein [Magnetospirillum sp.]